MAEKAPKEALLKGRITRMHQNFEDLYPYLEGEGLRCGEEQRVGVALMFVKEALRTC